MINTYSNLDFNYDPYPTGNVIRISNFILPDYDVVTDEGLLHQAVGPGLRGPPPIPRPGTTTFYCVGYRKSANKHGTNPTEKCFC